MYACLFSQGRSPELMQRRNRWRLADRRCARALDISVLGSHACLWFMYVYVYIYIYIDMYIRVCMCVCRLCALVFWGDIFCHAQSLPLSKLTCGNDCQAFGSEKDFRADSMSANVDNPTRIVADVVECSKGDKSCGNMWWRASYVNLYRALMIANRDLLSFKKNGWVAHC